MAAAGPRFKIAVLVRAFGVATVASAAYAVFRLLRTDPRVVARFVTGPGGVSRVLLLLLVLTNAKNMPLAWTVS